MKKENEIRHIEKEYLNEIRYLFPSIQKEEKQYLQGLSKNIEETLCNSDNHNNLSSKESFYSFFGYPSDIVHQYFAEMNLDSFCSYLRLGRLKKKMMVVLYASFLSIAVFISILLWHEHLSIIHSEAVIVNSEIVEYEEALP